MKRDMESQEFNSKWKDAFKEAEVNPSDNVWTNVELDLEKAEGDKMKRRVLFYKLMAAACIVFGMCIAGFTGFYYGEYHARQMASATGASSATMQPSIALQGDSHEQLNNNQELNENQLQQATKGTDRGSDGALTIKSSAASDVNSPTTSPDGNHASASLDKNKNLTASNTDKTFNAFDKNTAAEGNDRNRNGAGPASADKNLNTKADADTKDLRMEKDKASLATETPSEVSEVALLNGHTSKQQIENASTDVADGSAAAVDVNGKAVYTNIGGSKNQLAHPDKRTITAGVLPAGNNDVSSSAAEDKQLLATAYKTDDKSKLPPLAHINKIELQLPKEEPVDPFAAMMARLEQRERELQNEDDMKKDSKKKGNERLWTSLGMAAGSFSASNTSVNPTASNNNSSSFVASKKIADNQSKASGNTYSIGMNVGTKLAERWVVQGGVNYLKQNSAYEANAVVSTSNLQNFRATSINDLSASKSDTGDKLVGTAGYNVNNSLQFISMPVQAGYLAVNKKVAVQINAGVSTDLFIQNTIAPENSNIEKVTQGNGDASPYRPVNFSGLFGTELSYRLGKHYRIALNPGLRYPFNSIYKSTTGVSSNPLTMDVGMRFRYIFH